MKTFTLCLSFIKKNIIPICITWITLTVSLFMLTTILGQYKYKAYTLDVYSTSSLQEDVYFMLPGLADQTESQARSQNIRETVLKMDGVSHILNYKRSLIEHNTYPLNVHYWTKEMRDNFKLKLIEGEWFSDDPTETEAVIGGAVWDGVSVGDTVTLSNGLTVKVVGALDTSVVFPAFTSTTNDTFTTEKFFREIDTIIFLTSETIDLTKVTEKNMSDPPNFFVCFEEDATEAEREAVVSYLETEGIYRTYEETVQNSKNSIRNWVKEQFPLPLFLICIATINIICICAVVIKRSMTDMAKYYLMGCTKAKSVRIIALSMISIFSVPALLNAVLALYFPNFIRREWTRTVNYILDIQCVLPILLYVCLLIGILILMPMLFYRKYSPLDLYRRNL